MKPERVIYIPEIIDNTFPQNFGIVNPNLYRGGWPKDISFLSKIQASEIVTLYSQSDQLETSLLPSLSRKIATTGCKHAIFNIQTDEDLWQAGQYLDSRKTKKIYVHCQAGANRTGLVCLISQIIRFNQSINQNKLNQLIDDAVYFGFDYHQEKYYSLLQRVVTTAKDKGLLSANLSA